LTPLSYATPRCEYSYHVTLLPTLQPIL